MKRHARQSRRESSIDDAVAARAVDRIQKYADPTGEKGRRAKAKRRAPWLRPARSRLAESTDSSQDGGPVAADTG